MSLHNDAIRKDNEPEPKAFTHISTPQKKISLVLQANPSIKLNNVVKYAINCIAMNKYLRLLKV